jgi:hypothetical protein
MNTIIKSLPLFRVALAILLFFSLTGPLRPQPTAQNAGAASDINDTARLLAGLRPLGTGRAAELSATPLWQQHAQMLGADWERSASRRWHPIRSWSGSALPGYSTVFYPFSGPDFIYVYNYFPHASAYLLCSREAVGEIPDLARIDPGYLASLRNSFHDLFKAGYFVTKNMRVEMRGTLPLMLVMLARSGCTITHIERLGGGVEIRFTPQGVGGERRLIYASGDLSNSGFGGAMARIKQLNPTAAYIKSCSYLLHQNGFSAVRSFLLNQCNLIVQDDSGIPIRYFSQDKWSLRLYGTYTPPLNIFRQYYQSDLASLYASSSPKSLNFGVGYKWNPKEADLIVATAK